VQGIPGIKLSVQYLNHIVCVTSNLHQHACMLPHIAADIMFAITDQALTALCVCNIHFKRMKTDPSGGSQRVAVGCSPVRLSLGGTGSCLSCITLALTSSEVIVCFPQLSLSLQGPPGSGMSFSETEFVTAGSLNNHQTSIAFQLVVNPLIPVENGLYCVYCVWLLLWSTGKPDMQACFVRTGILQHELQH